MMKVALAAKAIHKEEPKMSISRTILAPAAALALALSLAACGGNAQSTSTQTEQDTEATTTDDGAETQEMGEYLIFMNTSGLGQVEFTYKGQSFGYGDQGITHADAGDKISMSAKPKEDGWEFVKWTKDGEDFSTDADIEVTVDGDATYEAVFEANL